MSAAPALAVACLTSALATLATGIAAGVVWHTRKPVADKPASALSGLAPVAVDWRAYQGLWFEQRRLDSWFERNVNYVTAQYALRADGFLAVTNTSVRPDGSVGVARGIARPTSIPGYAVVSFFPFVEGAYVVLYLDAGMSVVGSPDRKYLWLLTRAAALQPGQLEKFYEVARANKYPETTLAKLQTVSQF